MRLDFFRTFALAPALALAACTAGPDYVGPPAIVAPPAGSRFVRGDIFDAATPAAHWWDGLHDAELTRLINAGLANAPSIDVAQAQLRQSRATLARSRAALLPVLSGSAAYAYADIPGGGFGSGNGANELFNLGFDAQWELDLWGGRRRGIERTRAEAESAEARLADAQVSLSAEIARTYVSLRAREASLGLLDSRISLEMRLVSLAQQRFDAGTVSQQAVEIANMAAERSQAERAELTADLAALRDSLAVLSGGLPGSLDGMSPDSIPLPPAVIVVGDPATLIARRPDIRAAERELAAASAQIGVEASRRFPTVSLLGLVGIGGTDASNMFDPSQLASLALPQLRWSFLDFGRARAAQHAAEAGRDAALARYRERVLNALRDTEGSLARFGAARIALAHAVNATNYADRLAELERQRVRAGTVSLGNALEGERRAINAKLDEMNGRAKLTLAYVALTKALGLGWQVTTTS